SVRARTVVYNTNKIKPAELSSYEDLANPKWRGRLCLRSSKKVYNQSLVAMMIAEHGEAATEKIVRGWVSNLSTDPFSDDTRALEGVAAGQCDVTIVNTYYYGRLMQKNSDLPLAIYWPNQKTSLKPLEGVGAGVHINVSGAGITTHTKHEAAAIKLLEFLASDQAQQLFATLNMEYPANPKIEPDTAVATWGRFEPNRTNLAKAGELQTAAVKLMDRAGYR
ncbi:MAG: extracellular solute-binding protein, partial [Gallionella sp.]